MRPYVEDVEKISVAAARYQRSDCDSSSPFVGSQFPVPIFNTIPYPPLYHHDTDFVISLLPTNPTPSSRRPSMHLSPFPLSFSPRVPLEPFILSTLHFIVHMMFKFAMLGVQRIFTFTERAGADQGPSEEG